MIVEVYRCFKNGRVAKYPVAEYKARGIKEAETKFSESGIWSQFPESNSFKFVKKGEDPNKADEKPPREQDVFLQNVNRAMDKDYRCYIDYDYDTSHCTCHDSICRCTRILNLHVTKGTVSGIADTVLKGIKDKLLRYCVERVIRHNQTYASSAWDICSTNGYYGEEVGSAKLHWELRSNLRNALLELYKLHKKNDKAAMMFHVLSLEYGYILENIKNKKTVKIVSVDPEDLIIGAKDHYLRLEQVVVSEYAGHDYPLGVCVESGDEKYRLVDGYHRVAAAKQGRSKTVEMVELS